LCRAPRPSVALPNQDVQRWADTAFSDYLAALSGTDARLQVPLIDALITRLNTNCAALRPSKARSISHPYGAAIRRRFEKRPAAYVMFAGDQVGPNVLATGVEARCDRVPRRHQHLLGDGKTGAAQAGLRRHHQLRNAGDRQPARYVPVAALGALTYMADQDAGR